MAGRRRRVNGDREATPAKRALKERGLQSGRAMKPAIIMTLLLIVLLTGGHEVLANSGNPFGFETDKHPLKYEYCQKEKDPKKSGLRGHGYTCSSAPRPHPDFQEYFLLFVEDVGLCSIQAASNVFSGRGQVAPAEEKFEMFKGQIAKKYGPPTSKDTEQTNGRKGSSPKTSAPEMQSRKEHTNSPRVTPPKTSRPKHEESGMAPRRIPEQYWPPMPEWLTQDYGDPQASFAQALEEIDQLEYGVSLPDYHWSPEAGFKGLGNVKVIHLMARQFKGSSKVINVTFRLLTSDACQKKIDDKAEHAF